jgi:hypothetical protein
VATLVDAPIELRDDIVRIKRMQKRVSELRKEAHKLEEDYMNQLYGRTDARPYHPDLLRWVMAIDRNEV